MQACAWASQRTRSRSVVPSPGTSSGLSESPGGRLTGMSGGETTRRGSAKAWGPWAPRPELGPERHASAEAALHAGWLVNTLRGRLFLLVCFATVPAVLFIFLVAVREREAALSRMQTEALHLGGLASREHAHQLEGGRRLLRWAWLRSTGRQQAPVPLVGRRSRRRSRPPRRRGTVGPAGRRRWRPASRARRWGGAAQHVAADGRQPDVGELRKAAHGGRPRGGGAALRADAGHGQPGLLPTVPASMLVQRISAKNLQPLG